MSLLDNALVNKNVYPDNIYEKLLLLHSFYSLIGDLQNKHNTEKIFFSSVTFQYIRDSHPWLTHTPMIPSDNALANKKPGVFW